MKRNLFNHIPTVLLVLVFCTFGLVRAHAYTPKFNSAFYSDLSQKQATSVHTPYGDFDSSNEDLFEKETEDESKDEFNTSLPILNHIQDFTALLYSEKIFSVSCSNQDSKINQEPLYLATRNIRI